jgi:hypothetical protein
MGAVFREASFVTCMSTTDFEFRVPSVILSEYVNPSARNSNLETVHLVSEMGRLFCS